MKTPKYEGRERPQMTVQLPISTHKLLRQMAVDNGLRFRDVVATAIDYYYFNGYLKGVELSKEEEESQEEC